ncbi:protein takeout-like [Scylla paramamosain]|uniref:Juvenile hormone binding protein 2 n=1 Tax=Scylla paramamosain TaxID=85552 RepID=A0A856NVJ5_SCYPA|nr:juvenile hormone binding protein 2 [Scylla paramamosain]
MSATFNVLVILAAVATLSSAQFASQLRKCRVDNKEKLNTCLNQTLSDLRPYLSTGIQELSLPPLEPMRIKTIEFRQQQGAVTMQATFNDVTVTGISNFTATFINADPVLRELTVALYIPEMAITGFYILDGQIFLFPARGSGEFWANFKGVDATGTSMMSIETQEDGTERLRISNTNIDFTIEHLRMHLTDLFNGDEILGRAANLFINENGREILQEVKPQVVARLNEMVGKVMNDALSQLPVSAFLVQN